MPGGRHQLGLLETERIQVVAQERRHLLDADVLRADRRLADPALDLADVPLEVRVDMRVDVRMVARVRGNRRGVERLVGLEREPLAG